MFRIARVGINSTRHIARGSLGARVRMQAPKFVSRRFQSTAPKKPTGIKELVKEYGFSALGVYLLLSALDLPICYVIVHSLGQEEIQRYENTVKQWFGYGKSDEELARMQEINRIEQEVANEGTKTEAAGEGWIEYLKSQFSWTEFALAYGLHKSVFIFVRLPVTAAITPSIVKGLRGMGFKIGSDKLATTAHIAKDTIKDITASSSKFGTKPKNKKWFNFFF